jgi:hypothetical protein
LLGLVEQRSPSSGPVPVLLPPAAAPDVADLRVNETGSTNAEALVSWTSQAPAAITPRGSHQVVLEARDAAGNLLAHLSDYLDALPAFKSRPDLPPANPAARIIARVGPATGYRLYAWLPRPASDQTFSITVKMIDPLGRIGKGTADVPPLPLVQLGPIAFMLVHVLQAAPVLAVSWEILSPVAPELLHTYTLKMVADWPNAPLAQPLTAEQTLDQIVPLAGGFPPVLFHTPAQFGVLLHVPNTQQYASLLPNIAPVRVVVTLTDPSGAVVSQQGQTP